MTRADLPEDMIVYDPEELDAALIGTAAGADGEVAAYDYALLVEACVGLGMSEEDAIDWINVNILGASFSGMPVVLLAGPAGSSE